MKKKLVQKLIKNVKNIKVFLPNDIRLSFYILPLGDISSKATFTKQDLDNIALLEDIDVVNPDLYEHNTTIDDGNIYSLLDEGVLKGVATGADLEIYNYSQVYEKSKSKFDYTKYMNGEIKSIDSNDIGVNYFNNDKDYDFRTCILAEENPLGGEDTKVVYTFKGYLEVIKGNFSIIRNCDCDKTDIKGVYIPQESVCKYQLRHGDEILCTCKEDNGKMLIDSLFMINQIPRVRWSLNRPWFNELNISKYQPINDGGEYTKAIINKFGLFSGDNVFMYLTKTTQKNQVLTKFIQELNAMFDKIVYINSSYKFSSLDVEGCNIAKFTTLFTDSINNRITTILLASQYAKRLIEMGKKVAILIDDIEAINELDKKYDNEFPIIKSIFSAIKVSQVGEGTSFSFVSLRASSINNLDISMICKNIETLGIVFDNNEIDLFNSYRI